MFTIISVQVSAYTLVAISVDRYIAIMWPLKPRATRHHAKYIIALVWTVAVITAFPILLVTALDQPTYWHKVTRELLSHFLFIILSIYSEKWTTNYHIGLHVISPHKNLNVFERIVWIVFGNIFNLYIDRRHRPDILV